MIDWLLKNKDWLFSGLGVTVAIWLLGIIRTHGRKVNPDQTTVVVRIEHAGNGDQLDASSTGAVEVERVSPVTPANIRAAIESAPPLQRGAVAARYGGQRIEWDTELTSADEVDGMVKLHLRTKQATNELFRFSVICEVKLEDYRELAVLPEQAHVRVNGTIDLATPNWVRLSGVRLTFLHTTNDA